MDKTELEQNLTEEITEEVAESPKKKKNETFLTVLLIVLSILLILIAYLNTQVFFLVKIEGESMLPTLNPKEVVVANRKVEPKVGEIVIIDGEKAGEYIIKRVIAVGGQTVNIEDGRVFVDGKLIEEPYIIEQNSTTVGSGKKEWTLGENEIFFMGDNRPCSKDSRAPEYDTCKRAQIVGVVEEWSLKTLKMNELVYKLGEKVGR